jgi:hypothetical protein
MSYADDLKIFMNIVAQSPDGMGDPQLIGKFAKAKAGLNMMSSMNDMQAQGAIPPTPPQPMYATASNMAPSVDNMPQSSDGIPSGEPQNGIL